MSIREEETRSNFIIHNTKNNSAATNRGCSLAQNKRRDLWCSPTCNNSVAADSSRSCLAGSTPEGVEDCRPFGWEVVLLSTLPVVEVVAAVRLVFASVH